MEKVTEFLNATDAVVIGSWLIETRAGYGRSSTSLLGRSRATEFGVRTEYRRETLGYGDLLLKEISDVFKDMMGSIAADYYILKKYHNAANEDARAVLPNACCTKFYVTINARSLIEMSHLRLCTRAQAEIRSMFMAIKEQVATVCPELAAWMVPSCEANPKYPFCPEGSRCCGRHPKLADVYKPVEK